MQQPLCQIIYVACRLNLNNNLCYVLYSSDFILLTETMCYKSSALSGSIPRQLLCALTDWQKKIIAGITYKLKLREKCKILVKDSLAALRL